MSLAQVWTRSATCLSLQLRGGSEGRASGRAHRGGGPGLLREAGMQQFNMGVKHPGWTWPGKKAQGGRSCRELRTIPPLLLCCDPDCPGSNVRREAKEAERLRRVAERRAEEDCLGSLPLHGSHGFPDSLICFLLVPQFLSADSLLTNFAALRVVLRVVP